MLVSIAYGWSGKQGWDDPSVVPGMETYEDWKGVKGFALAGDSSYFPHMDDQWQSLVDTKRNDLEGSRNVYCLRDEEVCYVDGTKKSISVLSHTVEAVAS